MYETHSGLSDIIVTTIKQRNVNNFISSRTAPVNYNVRMSINSDKRLNADG